MFTSDGLLAVLLQFVQLDDELTPFGQAVQASSAFSVHCHNVVGAVPHVPALAFHPLFQFLLIVPVPDIVPFTNILYHAGSNI